MARDALVWRVLLAVTVHTEPHVQVHVPLGNRLMRDVAVARRALDVCADVGRVIEADVRLVRVEVDALPAQIESLFLKRGDLLDERAVGRDRDVAGHADVDARQTRDRTLLNGLVTVLRALQPFFDVRLVRKLDRLNGTRLHP